ncbi:4-diphosphocytidyl-2C-methyl-D-erythritol kinase [Methylobacterium sp. Leaf456]|uniref:nucleotidyltransferase family protein n=1 Tax=Methylobacterium sp. Leaf456 TaxID=1736382 RepID=UPI0006F346B5|nr:nucleotidyltransferase family protein [Methylobacterium sp. Leaf456]KQT61115.1 4-diphosphocytidyl-2C-methyl-D-erythritol kinase [Methylobacterium sp. Leaf456]
MPETKIAAVILAAGLGTRFGAQPKMLANFAGKAMVRHAAEAALASEARPVVVVLGAHAGPVAAALDGLDLTLVENPDHAAGLSTSLRAGLAALPPGTGAALVLLGDMPRIGSAHLDGLIAAYRAADPAPSAVVPVRDHRRGNPILLDLNVLKDALKALSGDRGAGPLLSRRTDVLEVPGDAATGFDVDRPDGLGPQT